MSLCYVTCNLFLAVDFFIQAEYVDFINQLHCDCVVILQNVLLDFSFFRAVERLIFLIALIVRLIILIAR